MHSEIYSKKAQISICAKAHNSHMHTPEQTWPVVPTTKNPTMGAWLEITCKLRVELEKCKEHDIFVGVLTGCSWPECSLLLHSPISKFRPGIEYVIVSKCYKLLFMSFPVFFPFLFVVNNRFYYPRIVVFSGKTPFLSKITFSVASTSVC